MIQSPFLRTVLILALLAFAAFCAQIAWIEGGPGTWLLIVLALAAGTLAVGFAFPGRKRIALRVVAGGVVALYAVYFAGELWRLLHGEVQGLRLSQPSALSAGIAVLIWAVPLLAYVFSGRTHGERQTEAALADDVDFSLRDQQTIAALEAAGANLTQVTEVNFYLEVPTAAHAGSIINVAQRRGMRTQVYGSDDGEPVTVQLGMALAPTWENIRATRADLASLALDYGGSVDGWEARVQPLTSQDPAI